MNKLLILLFSVLLFASCKKETDEIEHDLQFQSNVSLTDASYILTVDDVVQSGFDDVHKVMTDSKVHFILTQDTSTTFLKATIYVDGKAVSSDEGYHNIDLLYSVK